MFEEDVACQAICALVCKDLFVDCPGKRLTDLVAKVGHSLHGGVLCVVRVHDAHEVIFGESLEVEKKVFNHEQILVFFASNSSKEARKTVDYDHAQVNLQLSLLELAKKH